KLARERLGRFPGRFEGVEGEMEALGRLAVPHAPFAFVLSSQALHEIPHPAKREAFAQAFRLLRPGGSFFILDRIEPAFAKLPASYQSVWDRLNRRAALAEPMSYAEYVAKYGGKKDHPARLEELIAWLEAAGFAAAPLYLHFNRVLIAARRGGVNSGGKTELSRPRPGRKV
ncbi:MAG: methyltransferase domain-containing protein, partial [Nitrospinota bacterium]